MTIAKGRTSFEYYLDESFIILERYLDLVPVLIFETKTSQIKEAEKNIAAEKDLEIKEGLSTHLFNWNRFEDLDEMPDIFYKSYLISLCSYCEGFISKLYKEISNQDEIDDIKKEKIYFNDYWSVINKYIGSKIEFNQSKFFKVFKLRNLIVHGNSLLINPNKNDHAYDTLLKRNLYVNQFIVKYPDSLKLEKDSKLIICDNKFLKDITKFFHSELSDILTQAEAKLSNLDLHIDPYK
jgi:hypothetical protein